MINLDDKTAIAKIDKKDVYTSVKELTNQCRQTWNEVKKIGFPQIIKIFKTSCSVEWEDQLMLIIFIKGIFGDSLPVPFDLVNEDTLPAYVNENTLVMLSSYSGSTEETLSCARQALERKAKITAVTAGSKLGEFLKVNNFPAYIFNPLYNPAGQPRLGQGYMITGHMGILAKLGLIDLSDEVVNAAIDFLEKTNDSIEQIAKETSQKFVEKIPVIIASSHLAGSAHTLRNQFNETAKNFAAYSLIPELNHHLMEGLLHPEERILKFLFLNSSIYSPTKKKRFELTKDVVSKNNIDFVDIEVLGDSPFAQAFYALSFGGYLTFYLAIIYNQDPSVIPWVDYFKNKLSES